MSQTFLIILAICVFFAVWSFITWLSSRNADNSTFFSGKRKMPWPLVAVAMIGAPITGVTLVSVPGMVVAKQFSYLQMCLGFIVGYLVIAMVLVPIFYRLKIVSIYGYLEKRFGDSSSKTGAWLFFISKILGISIRLLIVCAMLQLLIFDAFDIPFIVCVLSAMTIIWLSTFKGGVKSVIYVDVLKSACLLLTIFLCLYYMIASLDVSPDELIQNIKEDSSTRIFFLDDPNDGKYFWKQFVAGIFIVIAMTGLDQDMMQRTLTCKNRSGAKKNLIVSSFLQVFVISLLLVLGFVMIRYSHLKGIEIPAKTDNLFPLVAFDKGMPVIIGVLLIIGLISTTFSSVASALTAMTTTMSLDILKLGRLSDTDFTRKRIITHTLISVAIIAIVACFFFLNEDDAISTVYTLISYTDGPILGLFAFGIFTKRTINERLLPFICLLSPVLAWMIQKALFHFLDYQTSFELLILNALITITGLGLCSKAPSVKESAEPIRE